MFWAIIVGVSIAGLGLLVLTIGLVFYARRWCIRHPQKRYSFLRRIGSADSLTPDSVIKTENDKQRRATSKKRFWWHPFNRTDKQGKLAFSVYKLIVEPTPVYNTITCSLKIINRDSETLRVDMSTRISKSDALGRSAAYYVTFTPQYLILPPGEAADVEIDILPARVGPIRTLLSFSPRLNSNENAIVPPPYYIPFRTECIPIAPEKDLVNWKSIGDLQKIGAGGSGTVYKAEWPAGRTVAVKLIHCSDAKDADVSEFRKEVEILLRLRHPCIVALYGVCIELPNLALVMEYVSKGSLASYIRSLDPPAISWALRIKFAFDAARALAFLHRTNLIHRDIKSDNFLVAEIDPDSEVNLKLADFGISKDLKETGRARRETVKMPGTVHWIAPEILSGGVAGKSSDVWSFGVVMWELVTHQKPYEEFKFASQVQDHVSGGGRLSLPIESPAEYAALFSSCYTTEAHLRPTFDDIVARLRQIQISRSWRRPCQTQGVIWSDSLVRPPSPTPLVTSAEEEDDEFEEVF